MPTFAKVDKTKATKWKKFTNFLANVLIEELEAKARDLCHLKDEINTIYQDVCQTCSPFLHKVTELHHEQYIKVMETYTKKIF